MPVLSNLKQLKYFLAALGAAVLMFDVSYYVMSTFPGSRNNMCVLGANFTPTNIAFSIVLSVMVGVLFAGFIALFAQNYTKNRAKLTSLSGLAFLIGSMSVICTACTLPVISLFGVTIWLDFFTNHEILFKVVSLVLMSGSLYLLNQQLKNACAVCVPVKKAS